VGGAFVQLLSTPHFFEARQQILGTQPPFPRRENRG